MFLLIWWSYQLSKGLVKNYDVYIVFLICIQVHQGYYRYFDKRIYLNKSKKVFGGNKCLQGFKSFFNQVNYKRDKSRYFYMY